MYLVVMVDVMTKHSFFLNFRNKTKTITIVCAPQSFPRMIYIHIDNCRDLAVSKRNCPHLHSVHLQDCV